MSRTRVCLSAAMALVMGSANASECDLNGRSYVVTYRPGAVTVVGSDGSTLDGNCIEFQIGDRLRIQSIARGSIEPLVARETAIDVRVTCEGKRFRGWNEWDEYLGSHRCGLFNLGTCKEFRHHKEPVFDTVRSTTPITVKLPPWRQTLFSELAPMLRFVTRHSSDVDVDLRLRAPDFFDAGLTYVAEEKGHLWLPPIPSEEGFFDRIGTTLIAAEEPLASDAELKRRACEEANCESGSCTLVGRESPVIRADSFEIRMEIARERPGSR